MSRYWGFKPYVPVAKRRANAQNQISKLSKKGVDINPVKIEGRAISTTFWGKAWCGHLEAFCDYNNRLGRGRTYVRNGSVVHMEIKPGVVTAMVSGSSLYDVEINITELASEDWTRIKSACAGQIASVIELLRGNISSGVMKVMTDPDCGLLPKSRQIKMTCSCPDGAIMCKHVAAVLYGVGSRLDTQPQLLFTLRNVNHLELIDQAMTGPGISPDQNDQHTIATDALEDVFGIELDTSTQPQATPVAQPTDHASSFVVTNLKTGEKTTLKAKARTKAKTRAKTKTQTESKAKVKTKVKPQNKTKAKRPVRNALATTARYSIPNAKPATQPVKPSLQPDAQPAQATINTKARAKKSSAKKK